MIGEARVRECLRELWGLGGAVVEAHHGGMNSATWFVSVGGRRWVAKVGRGFAAGLAVAGHVERCGVPAGVAEPALNGRGVVEVDGVLVALLRWVEGVELTGVSDDEQRVIGETLGRVHRGLRGVRVDGEERFHWVDVDAGHLGVRDWVRPAVRAAVRAYEGVGGMTWGLLHCDPAPGAFRYDRGVCGVIDWAAAVRGPLLYDLASAVMYVGGAGRALVEGYLGCGTVSRGEVEAGLGVMTRFRWAVQADYFARRLVERDLTGVVSQADNEKGLEDARRGLMSYLE